MVLVDAKSLDFSMSRRILDKLLYSGDNTKIVILVTHDEEIKKYVKEKGSKVVVL